MLIPGLRPYWEIADLSKQQYREMHVLCTGYRGSQLVEDSDSYFFKKLDGERPTELTFCLYLSRLFVDLAEALAESFWKDNFYRRLTISVPAYVVPGKAKLDLLPPVIQEYTTAFEPADTSDSDDSSLEVRVFDTTCNDATIVDAPLPLAQPSGSTRPGSKRKRLQIERSGHPHIAHLHTVTVIAESRFGQEVSKERSCDSRYKDLRFHTVGSRCGMSGGDVVRLFNKFAALDGYDPG